MFLSLKKMKNIKWQKDYTRAKKCTLSHTKEMGQKGTLPANCFYCQQFRRTYCQATR